MAEGDLGIALASLSPEWLAVVLAAIAVALLVAVLVRQSAASRLESLLRDEHRNLRDAASRDAWEIREEIDAAHGKANQMVVTSVAELGRAQRDVLNGLEQRIQHQVERAETHQDALRQSLDRRVSEFSESVDRRLGQMRELVDEKLQATLERRLGESFRQVSDRLEAVQKGLGEMQTLAHGVGDLKRVLTNVKARGTWGEVQLGALLDEILTPDQFERNVRTRRDSRNMVEFAVRLPGDEDEPIWLPIDAKFPMEDYLRLQEAAESGDSARVDTCLAALVRSVQGAARDIAEKYVDPPGTTDFAILFLPTEGLYAEVLRQPGLVEGLQRDYRVVVAGPTSLAALLNSLRMGFRTLAIERHSSEVWALLAAVKAEFARFGEQLDKARRQLDLAARAIDQTGTRTRVMARRLRDVESATGGPAPAAEDSPENGGGS